MKKFLTSILIVVFLGSNLYAEDYSEMSTQELIAIMGYVKNENRHKFERELKNRVPTMSENERKKYQENLKKMKK